MTQGTVDLVAEFEREQERIRAFSETPLGQLANCPGSCVLCGEKASCEMNVKLRTIEDQLFGSGIDGLHTRDVL